MLRKASVICIIADLLVQVTMSSSVTTSSIKKELNETDIPSTAITSELEHKEQHKPTTMTHLDDSVTKPPKPMDAEKFKSHHLHPTKNIDGTIL